MLYLFVDETYPIQKVVLRLACIAVRQDYFNRYWSEVVGVARERRQQPRNRLKLVQDLLEKAEYRTVIADIDMVKALRPLGTLDPLEQKGIISPRADLWTHCFGYSLDYAIRFAGLSWAFSTVDTFYDPQSLNSEHEAAFKETLRAVLSKLFGKQIRLRRIESVPKPQGGEYTKWQNGTWLAHWASRLPHPEKLDQGESNFVYRDLTSVIEQLVQRTGRWVSVAPSQSPAQNAVIPDLR